MNIWRIVVPGILGLTLAGCHSDPSIDYLERDNRKKEWEIWHLKQQIEDLKAGVDDNAPVRREPGMPEGGPSGPAMTRPGSVS